MQMHLLAHMRFSLQVARMVLDFQRNTERKLKEDSS